MKSLSTFTRGLRIVASDVAHGLFDITHNGFAMLGLAVFFAAVTLVLRPEARQLGEIQLVEWLHSRQMALGLGDVQGSERATASDPSDLPRQQATVAHWLGKKYRVAPEPLSALVAEAYELGRRARLDPTLILAVMAVESSFNPFAQSEMGAQGLMQVMTKVHGDKYEGLGGAMAAFDPLSNLRVGVKVLQECIARAGTVEGGLRLYVGAAATSPEADGGYADKVMAEQLRIQSVAAGQKVPHWSNPATPVVAPVQPPSAQVAMALRS